MLPYNERPLTKDWKRKANYSIVLFIPVIGLSKEEADDVLEKYHELIRSKEIINYGRLAARYSEDLDSVDFTLTISQPKYKSAKLLDIETAVGMNINRAYRILKALD